WPRRHGRSHRSHAEHVSKYPAPPTSCYRLQPRYRLPRAGPG
ncbi:MAG: hypothetical protein AVDCRST_MAG05-1893, partial [uncultured Rubrobacteraceae bacterium]